MKDLISKAKKTVILFNDSYDIDIYASIVTLADILKKEGKDVNISAVNKFPVTFRDLLNLKAPNNIDDLGKRRLVLRLNKKQGSVDNVTWSEDETQVKFIIAPKADDFNVSDVKFDFIGGNFDLIFTLGVSSLEDLGETYKAFKDTLEGTKIIAVGDKKSTKDFATKSYVNSNASGVSEALFEAIQDAGYKLSKEACTALLTGIVWKTEGFRQGLKNSRTFKNVATLLSKGANYNKSLQSIFGVDRHHLAVLGKVISKAKTHGEGIYGATLSRDDLGSINIQDAVTPEINVLSRIKDVKASFVIAPMADGKVWGIAQTSSKELNLVTQLKELKPTGNNHKVRFIVSGKAIAEVENTLVNALSTKIEKPDDKQPDSKRQSNLKQQGSQKQANGLVGKSKSSQDQNNEPSQASSLPAAVIQVPPKSVEGGGSGSFESKPSSKNESEPLKKAETPPEVSNRTPPPAQAFSGAQVIPGSSPMQTAEPLAKATIPPKVDG